MVLSKTNLVSTVLFVGIFFILPSLISANYEKDFNIPIYIETPAGIERTTDDYINYVLFNHKFELQKIEEFIQDESCSIRTKKGVIEIDEYSFYMNNKLNFNIPLRNDGLGQGSLTAQDKSRFSLSFDINEILETNSDRLVFSAEGYGRLNKEELYFDEIIITLDKQTNTVGIIGSGDKEFTAEDLEVSFKRGCGGEAKIFYLLKVLDKLPNQRPLEEVEELTLYHTELTDAYESLMHPRNIPLVPEFGKIIGILTVISSLGLFFVIRKN